MLPQSGKHAGSAGTACLELFNILMSSFLTSSLRSPRTRWAGGSEAVMNINEHSAPRVCLQRLPAGWGLADGHGAIQLGRRGPRDGPRVGGGRPWGDVTVGSFGGTPVPAESGRRDRLPGGPGLLPWSSSC